MTGVQTCALPISQEAELPEKQNRRDQVVDDQRRLVDRDECPDLAKLDPRERDACDEDERRDAEDDPCELRFPAALVL